MSTNFYGQPIIDPAQFHEAHVVNAMSAGQPPVCSCGWTPHGEFTMADHLADMGDYVDGMPVRMCGCGAELDDNGEHGGGYGAWCGEVS